MAELGVSEKRATGIRLDSFNGLMRVLQHVNLKIGAFPKNLI